MRKAKSSPSPLGGPQAHLSELRKRVGDNADEIWTRESKEIREKAVQLRELITVALDKGSVDPKAGDEAVKQARAEFGQLSAELRETRTTAKARLRRQIMGLTPDESPNDRRELLNQAIENFATPREVVDFGDSIAKLEHEITRAAELEIAGKADQSNSPRPSPSPAP